MKIVCMIGSPSYLHYLPSQIHSHFPLLHIIKEVPAKGSLFLKLKRYGFINFFILQFLKIAISKSNEKISKRILGSDYAKLPEDVGKLETKNINEQKVKEILLKLEPDWVIVQGTGLIKPSIFPPKTKVLNLHWGLSPFYKGSFCTEWAILNKDVFNIGYTVHELTSKIDGGDVYIQKRISISKDDCVHSINMRLNVEGTKGIIQMLKNGHNPTAVSQDYSKGKIYNARDLTWSKRIILLLYFWEGNLESVIQSSEDKVLHKIFEG